MQSVAAVDYVLTQQLPEARAVAAPSPVFAEAALEQLQKLRLQSVVIAAAHGLEPRRLVDEASNPGQRLSEPVLAVAAIGELADGFEFGDQRVDFRLARKGFVMPPAIEITPFAELPRGAAQDRARAVASRLATAQNPADGRFRIGQRRFEPSIEGASEQRAPLVLGGDLEQRIDACLDRPLVQQVGAKRMDRSDARLFEMRQGCLKQRDADPAAFSDPGACARSRCADAASTLRPPSR